MSDADISPERRAFGDRMAAYPLSFCLPILIGHHPDPIENKHLALWGGSGTLLTLGGRKLLVTCFHVIDKYRQERSKASETIFQVGDTTFDPLSKIIDEDEIVDLCIVDVTDITIERKDAASDIPDLHSYNPSSWPPPVVNMGDKVFFAGWPGAFRGVSEGGHEIANIGFSYIGIPITDFGKNQFFCQFDRNAFQKGRGPADERDFRGMSGGPVFVDAGTGRLEDCYLAGFIKEYNETFDVMAASKAALLKCDGSLDI